MQRVEGREDAKLGRVSCRPSECVAALCAAIIASLVWSCLATSDAFGATDGEQAYRVKAAFIFNFASLIEWPKEAFSDSKSPFVICHFGGSQTKSLFDSAYGSRMIEQRPIEVRHPSNPGDVLGCHIFMITAERSNQAEGAFTAAAGKSILTIGETEGFAVNGGMIGFYDDGPKIRFEINTGATDDANLRVSSRLLRIARLVSSEGE